MDTYEKKYKEAMKACKELSDAFDNETLTEELEKIFPELKESEDEKVRKALIHYMKDYSDGTGLIHAAYGVSRNDAIAWLEKQGNLMGALQEANKKIGELVEENYYLKAQGEQNPAWSEEDEIMINGITIDIEELIEQNAYDVTQLRKEIDWLRSLRPQNRWKPSEEQLNALDFFIDCVVPDEFNYKKQTLKDLLEQLKKLREE